MRNLMLLLDARPVMLSNSGSMEPLFKGNGCLSGTQPAVAGAMFRAPSDLNRNRLFRLLSLLAFFSGMVTSGDHTLFIYYIEET
jgi:hypothetical protein